MTLKYRRTLAAAILAGIAFSASVRAAELPTDADVIVRSGEACPSGTFESVPSYNWKDGHLVRDGMLCESFDKSKE